MSDTSDRPEPTGEPTEPARAEEQPEARDPAASEEGVPSSDDTLPEIAGVPGPGAHPTRPVAPASWPGSPGYQQPGEGWSSWAQSGWAQSNWPPSGWPPGPGSGGGYGGPPPRQGIVPPRPLGVGDIFAGAFAYIRAYPLLTLGPAAIVMAVGAAVMVVPFLITWRQPSAALATLWSLGSVAVWIVLSSVLTGLLLVVLARAVLGQQTGLGQALRAVAPRVPGLIGMNLLIMLIGVAAALVVVLPDFIAYTTGSIRGPEVLIGTFFLPWVLIPGYMYLAVLWALAPAAYVLEPIGVMAAFGRSRRLVHREWWPTFGVLVLAGFVVAIPAAIVFGVFAQYLIRLRELTAGTAGLFAIVFLLIGTFAVPFTAGVVGLLYTDRRIRRERFDLQIAQALSAAPFPPR